MLSETDSAADIEQMLQSVMTHDDMGGREGGRGGGGLTGTMPLLIPSRAPQLMT